MNEDNLSHVRREVSRLFKNKKKECLKDGINELESDNENKDIRCLYRGIKEFRKGYEPRNDLVSDKRGDLVADTHNILNRWQNYCCQLLNLRWASGVRQTEMHTAEPFVADPVPLKLRLLLGSLKAINLQVLMRFQQN
jgi:hypothetical protein